MAAIALQQRDAPQLRLRQAMGLSKLGPNDVLQCGTRPLRKGLTEHRWGA